jgi:hypothetical protein
MTDTSTRLKLPLLAAGQAQKETTHNEALALVDMLVQPVVLAVAPGAVPASPLPGQCWIVGPGAVGAWAGQDGALACWTSGGWRFSSPFEGMTVWDTATGTMARRTVSQWVTGEVSASLYRVAGLQVVGARQPVINAPSGGATIDAEARIVIGNILSALRIHGLVAT